MRHLAASRGKRFLQDQAVPAVGGQDPGDVGQLREFDHPATSPLAFAPHDDEQFIVEHLFHVKIFFEFELTHWLDQSDHHDIKLSLAKFWEFQLCAQGIHLGYAKDHPWVLSGGFLNHGRKESARYRFRTTYSNLARIGIGQGFDPTGYSTGLGYNRAGE